MSERPGTPASSSAIAIYALVDEVGIRYVGRAADPRQRFQQHLAERGTSPKCRWLEELRRRGQRPVLRVLETVAIDEAHRAELRWIRRLYRRGFELVNVQGTGRPMKRCKDAPPRRVQRSPAELLELARAFCRVAATAEVV